MSLPAISTRPALLLTPIAVTLRVWGGCSGSQSDETVRDDGASASVIDSSLFTHHYVSRDLPGDAGSGYGLVPPADFDGDGDLDIASKIWSRWSENANGGREHVDVLENRLE